ncbi:hypothetical protein FQ154_04925 [Paeniglutamicibacter gangotriensis]|uniref:Uncharacterized protein n=1 Tax=Paeniglutamicibacter gangotriensis TaxID=254787 RepID=A0A5B0EL14_9MICC|nr:DUF6766 family protein [Paeniglutamicibacter gangotriensis]KAA0978581.1 hypothetical protein FQ154_04925 [Paeniglutamicibacter gangotriensis]
MPKAIKDQALSICFAVLFLSALIGQSFAGWFVYNDDQLAHNGSPSSYWEFVSSSNFVVDVAENWQSEYLQFFLFILATIWLVQRGSPESKKPGDEGLDSDESQLVGRFAKSDSPAWAKAGGWRRHLYSNSLLLIMGAVFLFSWWLQSVAGTVVFNADQVDHGQPTIGWIDYVTGADFWDRTLQNWQSEFLAVGSMIALSIFLRQRGSSESKPVGTPHDETATEGQ